ncbi:MAG: hypothetical protein ACK5T0_05230 [Vampirovibrionales bacterium]
MPSPNFIPFKRFKILESSAEVKKHTVIALQRSNLFTTCGVFTDCHAMLAMTVCFEISPKLSQA